MNRPALSSAVVGAFLLAGCASRPATDWMKTWGGPGSESATGMVPAGVDGYYILGTEDLRFAGERKASVVLSRTDLAGEIVWEKRYGGEGIDQGRSIIRTSDGGLVIGAQTTSFGAGGSDAWLLKVGEDGDEVWSRTSGTVLDEWVRVAFQMADGGYAVAGSVLDPDDVIADAGAAGYFGADRRSSPWLVRTDAEGNELWTRTFDDGTNTLLLDALPTPDGGILFLATLTRFPDSDDDLLLTKVDGEGAVIWSRTWKEGRGQGIALAALADGNYLVTGAHAPATDTDLSESDFLFIKVDPEGNEIWIRTFGDPAMREMGYGAVESAGSSLVAVGRKNRDLYDSPESIVLLKMDENGQLLWQREFETGTHNMLGAPFPKADGGFIMHGTTRVEPGNFDAFMIETDPDGNALRRVPDGGSGE